MNLNLITKNQLNTINDINKYLNKSKDIKCLLFNNNGQNKIILISKKHKINQNTVGDKLIKVG